MFKKLSLIGAALAMTGTAIVPASQAAAQSRYEYRDGRGYNGDRGYRQYNRGDRRYDNRRYDNRRYNYRGRDERCDSSQGTIIGAIAGGLLGNGVAGRGDRTMGAIVGGAVGALAGREIDRSGQPGYCARRR
ncbi:glycine zipper 2TM domain-containing protein [Sphingomonas turrisvirgatae]|uniref:17 kDa surface antigen n=1 Tax=Sphingomonas turrisvirgatae TaxID=1888892 RepID=A0A1E3LYA5_9SPHN|nr:glycine zipper 2TM domain-containing protein [Sphingomonas turrisvirgatae]ODP38689.1 hypothetical protein BFL28_01260 [Sphingomonas turrisvirgatae]